MSRWHREPVPAAPFLAWFDERLAQQCRLADKPIHPLRRGGRNQAAEAPLATLFAELGWTLDAGSGYIRRLRNSRTGMAERARIEDALDHAGVGWWEVYGEDPVEPARWCRACDEPVAVLNYRCCWCNRMTSAIEPDWELIAA